MPSAASTAWSTASPKDLDALQKAGFDARHVRQRERPALRVRRRHRLDGDHGLCDRPRARRGSRCRSASTCCGTRCRRSRLRPRPARPSCARSSPAPMPPTWGRGRPMPARRCAIATGSHRSDLALLYNVSAEFAYSLDQRQLPDRARSAVFSSIPDAILVSGQITGEAAAMSDLEAVKKALPDTPVLANTGVKHATVARCAEDRRRLHRRLLAEGRRQHLERRRSGARGGIHAAGAGGARRMTGDAAPAGRRQGAAARRCSSI